MGQVTHRSLSSESMRKWEQGDCEVVSDLQLVMSTMNSTIEEVARASEFEYGAPYKYVANTEDDSSVFPFKAVLPQE